MSMPPANAAGHGFEGQLLVPGDDGYDDCRAVWNAMVDRRPRMIARCSSVGDVVAAVRTARELGLQIGVRCGGHSVLGLAVPDDGFMIDLTPMGAVRVDPQVGRAWVQGGALLGALDVAAQAHGLATTAGNVSHTGVGGLTLGGGMGWLARQHGLSCDNVVSFEVVTAAGDVMRASARDNPDLYWGLRGGGGNFGIVTEFEFRLHETVPQAFVAGVTFPLDQGRDVLRGWRDLNAEAPRRATFTAFVGSTPGRRRCAHRRIRLGRRPPREPPAAARPALAGQTGRRGGDRAHLPRAADTRGHAARARHPAVLEGPLPAALR
jgi:FAD/FMN-containing dehydrogenase